MIDQTRRTLLIAAGAVALTGTASASHAAVPRIRPEAGGPVDHRPRPQEPLLSAWTARPSNVYRLGEAVQLYLSPRWDVGVVIVSVDAHDAATVVFPNAFDATGRFPAGQVHEVPRRDAGYTLRVRGPAGEGVLRVIAVASDRPAIPPDWLRREADGFATLLIAPERIATELGRWHAADRWQVVDIPVRVTHGVSGLDDGLRGARPS